MRQEEKQTKVKDKTKTVTKSNIANSFIPNDEVAEISTEKDFQFLLGEVSTRRSVNDQWW